MAGSTARPRSSPARRASMSSSSARRCSSAAATWAARSGSSGPSPTRATSTASTTASRRSRATGWRRLASLPKHLAHRLMGEIEATGIPVIMLRGDGQINPDGVRDYDLLVPASVEAHVVSDPRRVPRPAARRGRRLAGGPARQAGVRALLQRTSGRDGRGGRRDVVGAIEAAWSCSSAWGRRTTRRRRRRWRGGSSSCGSSGTPRGARTARCMDVGGAVLLVSQFTLFADTRRGRRPGFTGAAPPEQAERLYERSAAALERWA